MKESSKVLLVFIIIFTFPGILAAAGFRGVMWGMMMEQVKTEEPLTLVKQTEDKLLYYFDLADLDTHLTYHFTDGRLTRAEYRIVEKRINTTLYIADFGKIQSLLKKKYGEPTTYKFVTDESGAVLSKGGLTIISLWSQSQTEILHILTGSELETDHTIRYKSKKYQPSERKAWEQNFLDDL